MKLSAEIKAKIAQATTDAVKKAVRELLKDDRSYDQFHQAADEATESMLPEVPEKTDEAEEAINDEFYEFVAGIIDQTMVAVDRAVAGAQV